MEFQTFKTFLMDLYAKIIDPSDEYHIKNFAIQNFYDSNRISGFKVMFRYENSDHFMFMIRNDLSNFYVKEKVISVLGKTREHLQQEVFTLVKLTFIASVKEYGFDFEKIGWSAYE